MVICSQHFSHQWKQTWTNGDTHGISATVKANLDKCKPHEYPLKKDSKKETAISTNFTRRCVVGQVGNIIIHNFFFRLQVLAYTSLSSFVQYRYHLLLPTYMIICFLLMHDDTTFSSSMKHISKTTSSNIWPSSFLLTRTRTTVFLILTNLSWLQAIC